MEERGCPRNRREGRRPTAHGLRLEAASRPAPPLDLSLSLDPNLSLSLTSTSTLVSVSTLTSTSASTLANLQSSILNLQWGELPEAGCLPQYLDALRLSINGGCP